MNMVKLYQPHARVGGDFPGKMDLLWELSTAMTAYYGFVERSVVELPTLPLHEMVKIDKKHEETFIKVREHLELEDDELAFIDYRL